MLRSHLPGTQCGNRSFPAWYRSIYHRHTYTLLLGRRRNFCYIHDRASGTGRSSLVVIQLNCPQEGQRLTTRSTLRTLGLHGENITHVIIHKRKAHYSTNCSLAQLLLLHAVVSRTSPVKMSGVAGDSVPIKRTVYKVHLISAI